MGYAVSGVAAAVASKVGLGGAYGRQWFCSDLISRTIGSRPQISDISSQAWDLEPGRRMGKWMGQWMKWMDRGKVALAVDVIRSLEFLLSVACAGSQLDQDRVQYFSHLWAMLAADLVRSSQFLPFGDCAGSRLDAFRLLA